MNPEDGTLLLTLGGLLVVTALTVAVTLGINELILRIKERGEKNGQTK